MRRLDKFFPFLTDNIINTLFFDFFLIDGSQNKTNLMPIYQSRTGCEKSNTIEWKIRSERKIGENERKSGDTVSVRIDGGGDGTGERKQQICVTLPT